MPDPKPDASSDRRQRVQSIETRMLVLKTLSRMGGAGSLTAIAAACGEHAAKVHRYLASFVREGLVAQNPATQHYHLGPEAVVIGMAALRQCDPVRLAEGALVSLREDLEITCFIAVMGNLGPTVMRIEEPVAPVTINVRAGSVLSILWSASGRAFLGFSDDSSVQRRAEREFRNASEQRQASLSSTDPVATLRQDVHRRGYAVVEDTLLVGISAVSAPIFDAAGKCVAVLTALGATNGFDTHADGPVCGRVVRDAKTISGTMGHKA
jgi:DNA-binding IclR family transcriptional regulator